MQFTLHALFRTERHVVAQVVEAVFVVGAVGDVSGISCTLRHGWHVWQVNADGQAKEFKQCTVIFGITLRQIVIDGNNVHAFAAQRVQVSGQGRGQGFTFTGAHLCDATFVEHHAANQLHIKVTHTEDTLTCFTYGGKGLRNQAFKAFAFFQALAEQVSFRFQFIVRELYEIRLHLIDDVDDFAHTAQSAIIAAAEYFS